MEAEERPRHRRVTIDGVEWQLSDQTRLKLRTQIWELFEEGGKAPSVHEKNH